MAVSVEIHDLFTFHHFLELLQGMLCDWLTCIKDFANEVYLGIVQVLFPPIGLVAGFCYQLELRTVLLYLQLQL